MPTRSLPFPLLSPLRACLWLLAGILALPAWSQVPERERGMTWEAFCEAFAGEQPAEEDDGTAVDADLLDFLHELYLNPLDLNAATREDLLMLPFLSTAQVDSILAYRTRRLDEIQSMGELLAVRALDLRTRRFLSLFVDVTAAPRRHASLPQSLWRGRNELSTHVALPCYWRDGFYRQTGTDGTQAAAYAGRRYAQTVRYRYRSGRFVRYGLTTDKDSGERPCDFVSAYAQVGDRTRRGTEWRMLAGDFEVRAGEGLLFGKTFFNSREAFATASASPLTAFRPHTSAEETRFLRGAAAFVHVRRVVAQAFVSFRRQDATMRGDTVQTIRHTGLHRTASERAARRQAGTFDAGVLAAWLFDRGSIGLAAHIEHFAQTVDPLPAVYNRFAFRGQTFFGTAVQYAWQPAARTAMRGEVAFDRKAHLALSHTMRFTTRRDWQTAVQVRALTPRFQSQLGSTLQLGSRLQNEYGALLSVQKCVRSEWTWAAYGDVALFPYPTYTARARRSLAAAAGTTLTRHLTASRHLGVRYTGRWKHATLTGYDVPLEVRTTQRFRVFFQQDAGSVSVQAQADFCLATRQVERASTGYALSGRIRWTPFANRGRLLAVQAAAAVFCSDDYASALYLYQPQVATAAGRFAACYHHGTRESLLLTLRPVRWAEISGRWALVWLFNQDHIASGTQRIASNVQQDADISLRILF